MAEQPKPIYIEVKEEEHKLVNYCREIGYGKFTVEVVKGLPKFIRQPLKDVKLGR